MQHLTVRGLVRHRKCHSVQTFQLFDPFGTAQTAVDLIPFKNYSQSSESPRGHRLLARLSTTCRYPKALFPPSVARFHVREYAHTLDTMKELYRSQSLSLSLKESLRSQSHNQSQQSNPKPSRHKGGATTYEDLDEMEAEVLGRPGSLLMP